MDFSTALEEIKRGSVVSRYSWRNKKVSMELGNFAIDNKKDEKRDISYSFFEIGDYGTLTRSPSLIIYDNSIIIKGWTPDSVDLFSDDWYILD